ncbi:unnamed protein product [Cladocopium goreaui]|uniref:Betaine aldehyde dehydrogenase 1 (OsBADH1) n=1 Tax=Cladocopium goreaui TaxID=2562237 RepID=A0A9P1FZW0_9DINO|nr:unnamed protein product [Cladocopium goreaui]
MVTPDPGGKGRDPEAHRGVSEEARGQGDLGVCADTFDYYAEMAPKIMKTSHPSTGTAEFYARIESEPLGVIGCITPWNFPLMQAVLKVAPALAAGCSVVLKPSPLASLTCCALGELVAAAGAPPGALNVITGGPPEALEGGGSSGQYLIDHHMLDKVSFTGSGTAGQKMLEASASKLRPTCLELGGKSAFIIFDAQLSDISDGFSAHRPSKDGDGLHAMPLVHWTLFEPTIQNKQMHWESVDSGGSTIPAEDVADSLDSVVDWVRARLCCGLGQIEAANAARLSYQPRAGT